MELLETVLLTIMATHLVQETKIMIQQPDQHMVAIVHSISKVLGGITTATTQISMVSTIVCHTQSSVPG